MDRQYALRLTIMLAVYTGVFFIAVNIIGSVLSDTDVVYYLSGLAVVAAMACTKMFLTAEV